MKLAAQMLIKLHLEDLQRAYFCVGMCVSFFFFTFLSQITDVHIN